MCIYTYIFTHINKGLISRHFSAFNCDCDLKLSPALQLCPSYPSFQHRLAKGKYVGFIHFPWDWLIFGHEMVATATQHGDINQSFRLGGSSLLVIACPACITVFLREYTSMFDCFFMIQEMGILSNPILSEGTTSNCQLVRCSPRIHIYVYIYINIYATISKG